MIHLVHYIGQSDSASYDCACDSALSHIRDARERGQDMVAIQPDPESRRAVLLANGHVRYVTLGVI